MCVTVLRTGCPVEDGPSYGNPRAVDTVRYGLRPSSGKDEDISRSEKHPAAPWNYAVQVGFEKLTDDREVWLPGHEWKLVTGIQWRDRAGF